MGKHLILRFPVLAAVALIVACSATNSDTGPSALRSVGATPGTAPGSSDARSAPGLITVSAAASLTEPFKKIGEDFTKANPGVEVRFNFDSSGTLARQIQDGAAADAFASADEANMAKLTVPGLMAGPPTVFARNQMTVVVKHGNPKNIKTLADLPGAGTISLCATAVPCGTYADEILKQAGVTIVTEHITRGQNAKATLAAVAEGDADAGIVYVTDVTGDKVQAVVIPDAQNAIATYPIGIVKASTNQSTTEAFIRWVLGASGQETLKAAGFLPPT